MGTSYGVGVRAARAIGAAQTTRARTSARVHGWNRAPQLPRVRSSSVGRALRAYRGAKQNKLRNLRQTQVLERVIRIFVPTPD
jgi:hypothetical protein